MGRSQTGRPCGPHPLISRRCRPGMSSGITVTFAKDPCGPDVIPVSEVRYPCITDPFATEHAEYCYPTCPVRLACLSHAASVRSEPGSNSSVEYRCSGAAFAGRCVRHLELPRSVKPTASRNPYENVRRETHLALRASLAGDAKDWLDHGRSGEIRRFTGRPHILAASTLFTCQRASGFVLRPSRRTASIQIDSDLSRGLAKLFSR